MEKKKIIFMDCDGVLNYTKWYVSDRNPGNLYGQEGDIDPECVKRIVHICEATGAKIVVSSDWRIAWPGTLNRLERAGFPEGLIVDKTPEHIWRRFNSWGEYVNDDGEIADDFSRGGEIKEWVDTHEDTYDYVILDDREDFTAEQKAYHFVHINPYEGITDKDMERAIEILSR